MQLGRLLPSCHDSSESETHDFLYTNSVSTTVRWNHTGQTRSHRFTTCARCTRHLRILSVRASQAFKYMAAAGSQHALDQLLVWLVATAFWQHLQYLLLKIGTLLASASLHGVRIRSLTTSRSCTGNDGKPQSSNNHSSSMLLLYVHFAVHSTVMASFVPRTAAGSARSKSLSELSKVSACQLP